MGTGFGPRKEAPQPGEDANNSFLPTTVDSTLAPPEPREDRAISQPLLGSTASLFSSILGDAGTVILQASASENSPKESNAGSSKSKNVTPPHQEKVLGKTRIANQQFTVRETRTSEASFEDFLGQAREESITDIIGKGKAPVYPPSSERTTEEQERLDGHEVTTLLSSQNLLCLPDKIDFGLSLPETPHLYNALFGDGGSCALPWDHLLNFWPQADPFLDPGSISSATSASHSNTSSTLWLHQWMDVLTRYNDEVWGELAHDVGKAREEVDTAQSLQTVDPANGLESLHRLQQILAHLRGA